MMETVTRTLVAMTAIAMNMPSAYTISWSKKEHPEQIKYLYAGLIITSVALIGAFLNNEPLLWLGLFLSFAYFLYVVVMA